MNDRLNGTTFELDPDGLKAAEFMQARRFLDAITGKTIAAAAVEGDRTMIATSDGITLYFCGFAEAHGPGSA